MNENMEKGRKEARIGLNSEKEIVRLINTDKQFKNVIKRCLNELGFVIQGEITAQRDNMKTDIFIEDNSKIGVSIKSSTKMSFHNLDRRWLEKWEEILDIPDNILKTIKEAILRIARNSKDYFILQEDRREIKDFFVSRTEKIITEIFTHNEKDLKLLMINDKRKHKLYLFKMEEVVNFLVKNIQNNVSFSPKGIIRLGDFITVQRKGGDSSQITIPKADRRHPGNQLQFKFSPLKFAEYIEENKDIKICDIQLT
ncbi:hypothetical protein LR013_03465 [candidate division NPL-UPA2 bacterium]|nr:hypothetical protein [candidate division NPL-UPA2 bacterium]